MKPRDIRKPINELTLEDLQSCPTWEYADEEEGADDQDETVVRPVAHGSIDPTNVAVLVAATFRLADGSQAEGFVTAPSGRNKDIGETQPAIITPAGHVSFWLGTIKPTAGEIEESYAALGRAARDTFPIEFRTRVKIKGRDLEGTIPGFVLLENWKSGKVKVIV